MSLLDFTHTCKQVALPLCKVLEKNCLYTSRNGDIQIEKIGSPATVALLIFSFISGIHLIRRTRKYYASFSKNEFVLFFYLYVTALLLDTLLVSNYIKDKLTYSYVLVAQLAFASTSLTSLIIGCITSRMFDSFHIIRSITVARGLCFVYLTLTGSFIYVAVQNKNGTLLFIFLVCVNLCIALVYLVCQLVVLRYIEAEVWAYGTLSIATVFFSIGCSFLFWGSHVVAFLSERYLDGLFFFHLFMFCTVLMVHKYWYSISDNEIECADILDEQ